MRNLEIKARCLDEATLDGIAQSAMTAGATPQGMLWQRDTYFVTPYGRLKLREERAEHGGSASAEATTEAHALLIGYTRPDVAGSRTSDYAISPAPDPAALRAALAATLGVWVVVEKLRALYLLGATRIHLDRVVGLGAFVELETVFGAESERVDEDALATEHQRIIALLGLDRLPVIAGSYSDLLEAVAD